MAALLADSLAGFKLRKAGDGHAVPVCAAYRDSLPAAPAGAPHTDALRVCEHFYQNCGK